MTSVMARYNQICSLAFQELKVNWQINHDYYGQWIIMNIDQSMMYWAAFIHDQIFNWFPSPIHIPWNLINKMGNVSIYFKGKNIVRVVLEMKELCDSFMIVWSAGVHVLDNLFIMYVVRYYMEACWESHSEKNSRGWIERASTT